MPFPLDFLGLFCAFLLLLLPSTFFPVNGFICLGIGHRNICLQAFFTTTVEGRKDLAPQSRSSDTGPAIYPELIPEAVVISPL